MNGRNKLALEEYFKPNLKLEAALEQLSQDPTYIEQTNNAGADVLFRGQDDYRTYLGKLNDTVVSLSAVLAP